MRFTRKTNHPTHHRTDDRHGVRPGGCATCEAGLEHCHGVLVLHADGRVDCDGADRCAAAEDRHDWWVPCDELGCGCIGEERGLEIAVPLAA